MSEMKIRQRAPCVINPDHIRKFSARPRFANFFYERTNSKYLRLCKA